MSDQVLVVGWDGAPFTDVDELIRAGEVPTLRRIAEEGYFGPLDTVPYVMSPCAWSTFLTGTNAGQHGVFDFYADDFRDETYFREPIDARSRKRPEIWKYFDAQDRSIGLVNVPITYPAEPVDEFMLAGVLSPDTDDPDFVHPSDFLDDYEELAEYAIDLDVGKEADRDEFLAAVRDMVQQRTQLAVHCMEACTDDVDVFVVVYTAPDRLSHYFWHFHDGSHPYRETETEAALAEYGDVLRDLFVTLDAELAELVDAFETEIGAPANVSVVSDHGMDSLETAFFVNQWLADAGYLTFSARGETFDTQELPDEKEYVFGKVDWDETQAYSIGKAGDIYVNLEGREPEGSVAPEDYESVRSSIAADLREVTAPGTEEVVVDSVTLREEVFSGPYTETAPDLLVSMSDGYYSLGYVFEDQQFMRNDRSDHPFVTGIEDGPGILCQSGPLFRDQERASVDVGLIDYLPTLLHGLALDLPPDLDGRVVEPLIVNADEPSVDPELSIDLNRTATDGVAESVERRLKDLGYR